MQRHFDLIITADPVDFSAQFRLQDQTGAQLAYRFTSFKSITLSRQLGLFDLRNFLRNFVEPEKETEAIAEIGVCIAEEVLGKEIFLKLWEGQSQRTLRIHLPAGESDDNLLATALARVPWEIARPSSTQPTLEERFLVVRIVSDNARVTDQPPALEKHESLRVLFVFAETKDSPPLGIRRERRQLLNLFEREIYPTRRVIAHVLSNGVTRERLRAQIQENGGYHIVHWSGHGAMNALELARPDGLSDDLSGKDLIDFFHETGTFLPRLVYLSACNSGEIAEIRNWNDFLAVARHDQPGSPDKTLSPTATRDIPIKQEPGYAGIALTLLMDGVPSVVAMRYSVGDDYARELGIEFYRLLLAHAQPKPVASALAMARRAIRNPNQHQQAQFAACDHATPVLYGAEQPGLPLINGRSDGLVVRRLRLHQIAELTVAEHAHFVGRAWQLAGLGASFVGASYSVDAKPVAVITGLGGMGKTALAAEALALWEDRFKWVLLYQAKPGALPFEAFLTDIHTKLMTELGRYHQHVASNPADAIFALANGEFTGSPRQLRLIENLVRALKDEAILLVLDNFETNLKPIPEPGQPTGGPVWACQDPVWDDCLKSLAENLVGGPSRVLITCRRPLAALRGAPVHSVQLGPLPPNEAALYLREHRGLNAMIFGGDAAERALAIRLLTASRFHPLLMDHLARLAVAGQPLRPQLLQALELLEKSGDLSQLPALFDAGHENASELTYLNDALVVSIDVLIESAAPAARRLLWIVALADDPATLRLVGSVWTVCFKNQETLPAGRDLTPYFSHLLSVGLAILERSRPDDDNPNVTCHELVRERIRAWMTAHPADRLDCTENQILVAYAERMEAAFRGLRQTDTTAALEAGRRAITYYVTAHAFDRLSNLAGNVVIGASDPQLLTRLLPHLQSAVHAVPPGQGQWRCLLALADAMDNSGGHRESLPFYEESAVLAKSVAEGGGADAPAAWMDYATAVGNWAIALQNLGEYDASFRLLVERVETLTKLDAPAVSIVSSELEVMHLVVKQGGAEQVLPEIEKRVAIMEEWRRRIGLGERLIEVPFPEQFNHLFLSALTTSRNAWSEIENWEAALRRTDQMLELRRLLKHPVEQIAMDESNRAIFLVQLKRFHEAKPVLEKCLRVFQNSPENLAKTYHTLADMMSEQDDVAQAVIQERRALAIFNALPNPDDRCACHYSISNYLHRIDGTALAEAASHRIAALTYAFATGLPRRIEMLTAGYAIDIREKRVELPNVSLSEVLAQPAFAALGQWLGQKHPARDELQVQIDQYLEACRQFRASQEAQQG